MSKEKDRSASSFKRRKKTVVLAADFASRLWGENFVQRPVLKSVPEQRIQVLE